MHLSPQSQEQIQKRPRNQFSSMQMEMINDPLGHFSVDCKESLDKDRTRRFDLEAQTISRKEIKIHWMLGQEVRKMKC